MGQDVPRHAYCTDFRWLFLWKGLPDFFSPEVLLSFEVELPSPSTVWGNQTEGGGLCVVIPGSVMHFDPPLPMFHPRSHVVLSLRRLHPWAWRWRSSAPSSGQNAGVSTAAPFLLPLFLSRPPPPLPLSVVSSKDALSIS